MILKWWTDWNLSRRTLILSPILISLLGMTRKGLTLKLSKTNYLAIAKSYLGTTGRPNIFTRWYAFEVKDKGFEFGSWCAMFLSYCSYKIGLLDATGRFAYCPYWVEWFKKEKRWGKKPKVGAFVFFDWNGSGQPDHVGVVEAWKPDGLMYTIEGNKGDKVVRVYRDQKYVLGYGYPMYPASMDDPKHKPKAKNYTVKNGDTLSSISRALYGTTARWAEIYNKNRKLIGPDPDTIQPGMKLVIP